VRTRNPRQTVLVRAWPRLRRMGVRLGSNGLTGRLRVRIVILELSGPSILVLLVRSRRSI
jgi:hypothetical protein